MVKAFFRNWLLLMLALIPLCVFGVRAVVKYAANAPIESYYETLKAPKDEALQAYRLEEPLETMDLSVFGCIDDTDSMDSTHIRIVKLPCDVVYYSNPDGKTVKELKAGTEVFIDLIASESLGYGLCGMPSYDYGWYYVSPFVTAESAIWGADEAKEAAYGTKYYVSRETLEAVAAAVYAEFETDKETMTLINLSAYNQLEYWGYYAVHQGNKNIPIRPEALIAYLNRNHFNLTKTVTVLNRTRYNSDSKSFCLYTVSYGDFALEINQSWLSPNLTDYMWDDLNISLIKTASILFGVQMIIWLLAGVQAATKASRRKKQAANRLNVL